MATVKELVAQELLNKHDGKHVHARVVDVLVKDEVERRVAATVKVVKMLHDAEAALKKINRPDVDTFNADGSVATSTYSKARIEEIKKAKDLEHKIAGALDSAWVKNEFDKVFELAK